MVSEAQKRATIKYQKEHTVMFSLRFNYKYDADILDKLSKVSNKAGYIKTLIREDIVRDGDEGTHSED